MIILMKILSLRNAWLYLSFIFQLTLVISFYDTSNKLYLKIVSTFTTI